MSMKVVANVKTTNVWFSSTKYFNFRFDMIWDDMIWYMIWYEMIWYMIYSYLSTAVGLTPGGSNIVHIYTKTIHRTKKLNRIHRILHT
jgi:hypothetical protein